ncbi:anti-sigma factor family protein [Aporhodopirellula aestuarii]
MRSCHEITMLVSQSLERPLPLRTRMAVWMHLRMCRLCAAFRRDQHTLHKRICSDKDLAARVSSTRMQTTRVGVNEMSHLSPEAKQRIKIYIAGRLR